MEACAPPLVFDQQILARSERLNPLSEALNEVIGSCRNGLPGNGIDKGEHVFGAVVNLTHEQADLLLVAFTLGDVSYNAGKMAFAAGSPFRHRKLRNENRAVL